MPYHNPLLDDSKFICLADGAFLWMVKVIPAVSISIGFVIACRSEHSENGTLEVSARAPDKGPGAHTSLSTQGGESR